MALKSTSTDEVIRGHFHKRRLPERLRQLNESGTRSRDLEVQEVLKRGALPEQGYVFLAMEVWQKASLLQREAAKQLLDDYIKEKTVDEIAWDFVLTDEEIRREFSIHTTAIAHAFLMLVYGTDPTAH